MNKTKKEKIKKDKDYIVLLDEAVNLGRGAVYHKRGKPDELDSWIKYWQENGIGFEIYEAGKRVI